MNICTHCGALAKGFSELGVFFLREGASCSYCRKRNFRFRCVKCLWNFQGLPRKWIHQLKYYDGEYLVADLEKILSEYSEWYEYLAHAVLVPVPLHWRRHWQRDYNQSHLIARTMAKVSGAFMVPLLSRCKFSRSQTELTRCERWSSVQGVFTVNRRAKGINRNHRVILVDDVLTTGATLHECATVLHENGFECVDVAVLAHG
jgi:ComF family protein